MGNIINSSESRGPPAPLATQGPNAVPPPYGRPGNNSYGNRPDLNFSQNSFSEFNDGISLRENFENTETNKRQSSRAEMRGPSDLTDILSGLKTKTINIQEQGGESHTNDNSTISISDLKDMQSNGNMPKRSGRRKKSASNTVSLDI
jgi:hypothetical protein